MIIVEYRMPLPLTVEEYNVAQLYMVSKASEQQTSGGEGIEIIKNEPYANEHEKGQFTHKIIHLKSRIPRWLGAVLPAGALEFHEQAWNAYPVCKTVYNCPYFGAKFSLEVHSRYIADCGDSENVFNLSAEELKAREVEYIDIAMDPIDSGSYKKEEDPQLFTSQKAGRGPWKTKDWRKSSQPVMTCYKLCKVNVQLWPLQGKIERFVHQSALRDVFFKSHRQCVCWMDEWYGLTIEDIRRIEAETKEKLKKQMEAGAAAPAPA
eukprot:TRINITY_DN4442_c0_g1_i1.p1 TRINITY_DN4442_c0_g1~~TRINITY_DN4442_c0_g1_i1.p1  ORF type:complete len:264 (-),score=58.14 TRINITY_DN4442_c0_g1_i1:231-1022(-)